MVTPAPPVIAISGWKNSGKTTLVTRLVTEFTRRGYKVATIKHTHHDVAFDDGETDSARHRRAGAQQTVLVSGNRWFLVTETPGGAQPSLIDIVAQLGPADLVIAEGFKSAPVAKIETRRSAQAAGQLLADRDATVIAIAADYTIAGTHLPVFQLDDVKAVADHIAHALKLPPQRARQDAPSTGQINR